MSRVRKESTYLLRNLPEDVGQKILECLPLQDAVRTSILSTHWRYKWTKLTCIILDQQFFSTVVERRVKTSDISTTYTNIVNNVLLCHVSPLRRFSLYIPHCITNGSIVFQWLRNVSQKSVCELFLRVDHEYLAELPSTLFLYAGLTRLTLFSYKMSTFPQSFTGFPCLTRLTLLDYGSESAKLIERFISSCPQLRYLQLHTNSEVDNLTIHAPNLVYFNVRGLYRKLFLGNTTKKIKTLELDSTIGSQFSLVFSSLPVIRSLRLGPYYFKTNIYKHVGDQTLVNELERLKTRTLKLIGLPIHCPSNNYFALKLLNSYQLLQRLYCEVAGCNLCKLLIPEHTSCGDFPNFENGNFPSLKYVELDLVSGLDAELQFIRVVLKCSPVLEVMTIKLSEEVKEAEDRLKIAMKLMQFPRASINAQIVFKT